MTRTAYEILLSFPWDRLIGITAFANQGNHVAYFLSKLGKDMIYEIKIIVRSVVILLDGRRKYE